MMDRATRWLLYLACGLLLLVLLGALVNLMLWAAGIILLIVGLWLTWRVSRQHPWAAAALMVLATVVLARMAIGLWWTLVPWLLAALALWAVWAWWVRHRSVTPPTPSGGRSRREDPPHHATRRQGL